MPHTIETDVPARTDRLPWARWHWIVVLGLGAVGRFRRAMHAAKHSGRIREVRRGVYGPRVPASEQQQ